jgi:hypothetical protein
MTTTSRHRGGKAEGFPAAPRGLEFLPNSSTLVNADARARPDLGVFRSARE